MIHYELDMKCHNDWEHNKMSENKIVEHWKDQDKSLHQAFKDGNGLRNEAQMIK